MSPDRHTFQRRTSYGSSSTSVGQRGARTRGQVVAAALDCFAEKGFHGTSVEDIAARAEASRATLYQYFESKDAVFLELMEASGATILQLARDLGPLGPTAQGLDSLHRWLTGWADNFDRYTVTFVEWAHVNAPSSSLRPRLNRFVETHTNRLTPALERAGFEGCDPRAMAICLLSLVSRFNHIRHTYPPGLTDAQLLDSLAVATQLLLFPATPRAVLDAGPHRNGRARRAGTATSPVTTIGPLASLPPRTAIPVVAPFDGLGDQAARTVRHLLDAAGEVFADVGYEAATVDHIVTAAGVARGTFYRYFDDKLQLMAALANECAADLKRPYRELGRFGDLPDPAALRRWLHDFRQLQLRYTGVLRAWAEGSPTDPEVLGPCRDVVTDLGAAVRELFGPKRSYPLLRRAAGMMLAGVLEHFPNEARGGRHGLDDDAIVEVQALFVERVLLAR